MGSLQNKNGIKHFALDKHKLNTPGQTPLLTEPGFLDPARRHGRATHVSRGSIAELAGWASLASRGAIRIIAGLANGRVVGSPSGPLTGLPVIVLPVIHFEGEPS